MSNFQTENIENFIFDTLREAGKIALKYFRNESLEINKKADGSSVTNADIQIEEYIRSQISQKYSEASILGEEKESIENDSEYRFVIDPIDGTSAFMAGKPTFGIMIALMKDNKPLISGIYQPYADEMWVGSPNGLKFYLKGELQTNSKNNQSKRFNNLATTSIYLLDDKGKETFNTLKKEATSTTLGGDCYNYCLLANGVINVVYEQGLKPYDYIPLIPIVEASGGIVCDSNGKNIESFNKPLDDFFAFSNKNIKDLVLNKILQID